MLEFRRLPVSGIANMRDLGGWAVSSGVTKYGVFLRSALPRFLSREDEALLRDYGLKTVIDFRSAQEAQRAPDPLRCMEGLTYMSIPMFDSAAAGAALRIKPEAGFSWQDHYIRMAEEQKGWMAKVIGTLAVSEGCTLFHCTTGKDRAGLISALILSLCSVSDEDVIADYCVSEVYLRSMYEDMESYQKLCGGDLDCPFYCTSPKSMRAFLSHLRENYGGAARYLADCGLTEAEAERVRYKLSGKF